MIRLLFVFTLLLPIDIGKINSAKSAAKKAFQQGDYATAASQYQYLIDSLGVREDEVILNLAHARFRLNDTIQARQNYQQLTGSKDASIRSNSFQQLGVINTRAGKLEEALQDFRAALKADPGNNDARFNYEMVKKKLEEQEKKQNQDQNKNKDDKEKNQNQDQKNKNQQQNKKDQQQQQKKNQNQQNTEKNQNDKKKEEKEQQQQQQNQEKDQKKQNQLDPEKMKNMKVSEEKARMILEAMKSNEVQYLQQNRRKATKPKDKGKPDW